MADAAALREAMNTVIRQCCPHCTIGGSLNAIVCTKTANFGKWFRACLSCSKWIEWVDIDLWLFNHGFPPDAYRLVQPRSPDTPPPGQQWGTSTTPPYASQPFGYGGPPSGSTPTFPQPPPSSQNPPPSQAPPTQGKAKVPCSNFPNGCRGNGRGALGCTYHACKPCCEHSERICKLSSHNKGGERPVYTPNPDVHFARPMPVIPVEPQPTPPIPIDPALPSSSSSTTVASTSDSSSTPEVEIVAESYRRPVSAAWALDHIKQRDERDRQLKHKAEKTRNELAIAHRVLVVAYLVAGNDPRRFFSSQIHTWPTLDLGKLILELKDKLGVLNASEMEVCYFLSNSTGSPTWFDADHTITVKSNQKIFLRRVGLPVDDEALFKENRAQLSTVASPTRAQNRPLPIVPILSSAPSSGLKRPAETDGNPRASKQPCIDLAAGSGLALEVRATDSMSPVTLPPSFIIDIDDDEGDDCWAKGYVVTSPTVGPWPKGMYVRDMAKAFSILESVSDDANLTGRFASVFPGCSWVKSTFFRNRKFWKAIDTDTRRAASQLTRDSKDDLWVNWRAKQPLWKTIT